MYARNGQSGRLTQKSREAKALYLGIVFQLLLVKIFAVFFP
jgi:hypothetical protein